MNSSAGIPFSTCTFLKTSSAISDFSAGTAWPPANATHTVHTTVVAVAQRIVRDPRFMLCPFVDRPKNKYTSRRNGLQTVAYRDGRTDLAVRTCEYPFSILDQVT